MADPGSRTGQQRYTTPELLQWLNQLHARHDQGLRFTS